MRICSFPLFNGGYDTTQLHSGGGQLPPDARAVAIASSSLVDACQVGSRVLGVGHVLPVNGGEALTPVRGFATGGLATINVPNYPSQGGEICTPLELIVWTCGECPFMPGPLANRRYAFEADKAILDTVNYRRILRVPWQGRGPFVAATNTGGPLWMRVTGAGTTPQVTFAVRGVSYLGRATAFADPSQEPGNFEPAVSVVVPQTTTTNGDAKGNVFNFGGNTLPPNMDELQVWALDSGAAWAGRFAVWVDPWGLHA